MSLEALTTEIVRLLPLQANSLPVAVAALAPDEQAELEEYLAFAASKGWDVARLAEAYQSITNDTLREQVYFQRNGHYRHSDFESVAKGVYFDDDYMSRYMYGLALTLYLWPNHLTLLRFFRQQFPRGRAGRYLEVGPGHGAFFRWAVRHGAYNEYLGVDISPTSLEMTKRLLAGETDLDTRACRLVEADFLEERGIEGPFDALVMGEVLEHVEQPGRFLSRLRELAAPDAFIYISTAINAPAVDHIYLFRNVDEVASLAQDAGLRVVETCATPYVGCSMEETIRRRLPVNVAMVLSR